MCRILARHLLLLGLAPVILGCAGDREGPVVSSGPERAPVHATGRQVLEPAAYGVVTVRGPRAAVTLRGGSVRELLVTGGGQVVVAAGRVDLLSLSDGCTATLRGGRVTQVTLYAGASLRLDGAAHVETLDRYGDGRLAVASPQAWIGTLQIPARCGCVDGNSRGGLDLAGGRVDYLGLGPTDTAVRILGRDLEKSAYGGSTGYGFVRGRWTDGRAFRITFLDADTYSRVELLESGV